MALRRSPPALLLGMFSGCSPSFAERLALARKREFLDTHSTFRGSQRKTDTLKVARVFVERLTDALCYAA
jgi:hypothetical protein